MKITDEIWVLADDRPGNYSQASGLADEIGGVKRIINISYGKFALLPNFLLGPTLAGVSQETKDRLKEIDHLPKIIISAGRRTAPIALYLKKKSRNRSKIIQIMNPAISHKQFDFIILPRHDHVKKSLTNVIRTLGALTKINNSAIKDECKKFPELDSKKTKIALLIGGDSKKGKFSTDSAKNLIKIASRISKNMNAQLVVLTSRRTGVEVSKAIHLTLKDSQSDFIFFDYRSLPKESNPYLAIAGFADYFIVTGDSVSMISEMCSTQKPVYIYDDGKISSEKHKKFHKSLHLENYVRKLDNATEKLEKFNAKKLDETSRIANIIKKYLK